MSVYVVGQVHAPGVVSLSAGARVVDAIKAAGGATSKADLTAVNLARRVTDGEQIVVPRPGQPIPAAGASSAAKSPGADAHPGQAVNLNTATEAQLDELPGIGPVIAARIVAWRQENGQFTSVDQLGEVSGIGNAILAKVRPLVTV
jgi:competence protein ComEA